MDINPLLALPFANISSRSVGGILGKGVKYMGTEEDLTPGGGHIARHTDHVSQKCPLET